MSTPLNKDKMGPVTTSIMWNDHYYMNQTWFNLTTCLKIVLMTILINYPKPEMSISEYFEYLRMNELEQQDWVRILDDLGAFDAEDPEEAEEAEALEVIHSSTLQHILATAEGHDEEWQKTLHARLENLDATREAEKLTAAREAVPKKFTVTQNEINETERFILCRVPEDSLLRRGILRCLHASVGLSFNGLADLPHPTTLEAAEGIEAAETVGIAKII